MRYEDLSNQKFGKLTVLKIHGRAQNRTMLWECVCNCGKIVIVRANHLKHNHTSSCGCYHKEKLTGLNIKNMVGHRFGKLTVISLSNKKHQRAAVWKCVCDCGKYTYDSTATLNYGHKRSCGCLHFEMVYKGGISCEPYCFEWSFKEFKDLIKDRDQYKCLNPYCHGRDKMLSIHHIDYNKKNCGIDNLITICRSCNVKANTDRDWHKTWYQAILYNRYKYKY